jgi:hypothetical protein
LRPVPLARDRVGLRIDRLVVAKQLDKKAQTHGDFAANFRCARATVRSLALSSIFPRNSDVIPRVMHRSFEAQIPVDFFPVRLACSRVGH